MNAQKRDMVLAAKKVTEIEWGIPLCADCGQEIPEREIFSCYCAECEKSL